MSGKERRSKIVELLTKSEEPITGSQLAMQLGVSRQIIVSDMNLLKADCATIIATSKGYIIAKKERAQRVFKMYHGDEEIEDELYSIVDLGGTIKDVFVRHRLHGEIRANMQISSRCDVDDYLEGLRSGKSQPLKNVTENYHYHTIEADSQERLDAIEEVLKEKNYLAQYLSYEK